MRHVLTLAATSAVLALGIACEEGGGAAVPVGTDCPQPGYVTPTSARVTMNRLVLTGLPLYQASTEPLTTMGSLQRASTRKRTQRGSSSRSTICLQG